MANPSVVSLQLQAAAANGIAQAQQPAAAGNLVLNGSLVTGGIATMDVARRIAVASSGADPTVIFTIVGTNASGAPITDTVKGVSGDSVNSTLDFLTVSQVSASAGTVGNITVGTSGVGSTPWVLDNFLAPNWNLAVGVVVSGTVNYTVEYTYDDPNTIAGEASLASAGYSMEPRSAVPPTVWALTALSAKTANADANFANQPIFAHRLTINSGTGNATMQSIQSGIGDP